MDSFDVYRRLYSVGSTVGETYKDESDLMMEATWDNDINSRPCYIYDFFHDDQPDLNIGMTYTNTTKTKIDAKFMISKYSSISKNSPELQIMFKPSQKTVFTQEDALYYLEEYKRKYGCETFVGCYIDIPDKDGVYRKYMICLKDIENNQFQKYFVLPCDYQLMWIRKQGNKRIKQKMWCVLRDQNSYNSGLWTDRYITSRENQEVLFIPTNDISQTIWYLSEDNESNQRLIVDVPTENPNVWQVSKIERVNVRGRTRVTLYQTEYDPHKDYIEYDGSGNIIGMWADYYSSDIEPIAPPSPVTGNRCEVSASTNSIKSGGSYKLLKAKFINAAGEDVTRFSTDLTWTFKIDEADVSSLITVKEVDVPGQIRIHFDDDSYLGKVLTARCTGAIIGDVVYGEVNLEIVNV